MPAKINLRQRKIFAGPLRFGVQEETKDGTTPVLLTNCFVVDVSTSTTDRERFVRVATLDDLVDAVIPIRQLNCFADGNGPIMAQAGDTLLIVGTVPNEWGDSPQVQFGALGTDGDAALLDGNFWWSVAAPAAGAHGLGWQLWRAGVQVGSGTQGYTRRQGGDGLCLTSQFMPVFPDGQTALNHVQAIQSFVNSLASSAGLDGAQFEQFAPGNPIDTSFP